MYCVWYHISIVCTMYAILHYATSLSFWICKALSYDMQDLILYEIIYYWCIIYDITVYMYIYIYIYIHIYIYTYISYELMLHPWAWGSYTLQYYVSGLYAIWYDIIYIYTYIHMYRCIHEYIYIYIYIYILALSYVIHIYIYILYM